ncbi:hypothetical protein F5144DRAFT_169947 [Chaetomium tenue]|uniref:Uncharacterized protein n=1 Tax=Chaetomium tenue TaxID=1854479 RepID=A0ACB7PD14_9PEZI|nr:hypothetical protein F5144DRAFT_169947 [Chaetomium globosum]
MDCSLVISFLCCPGTFSLPRASQPTNPTRPPPSTSRRKKKKEEKKKKKKAHLLILHRPVKRAHPGSVIPPAVSHLSVQYNSSTGFLSPLFPALASQNVAASLVRPM